MFSFYSFFYYSVTFAWRINFVTAAAQLMTVASPGFGMRGGFKRK